METDRERDLGALREREEENKDDGRKGRPGREGEGGRCRWWADGRLRDGATTIIGLL